MEEQMSFYDTGAHTRDCIISEDGLREYLLVDTPPKENELVHWNTILVVEEIVTAQWREYHVYDLGRKFIYLVSRFESAVNMHEKRWEKWKKEVDQEEEIKVDDFFLEDDHGKR